MILGVNYPVRWNHRILSQGSLELHRSDGQEFRMLLH